MALSAQVGGVGLVCRQRREQRLRLGDRGEQWRRREACERRREHCLRIPATAVRSVELSERKGGEQLVAARALFVRDGDGGLERLLGGRRVCGVALEQDIAPQAMEVGVRETLFRLRRDRESLVDQRQGGVGTSRRSSSWASIPWNNGETALLP
jgi:hypothetical protein